MSQHPPDTDDRGTLDNKGAPLIHQRDELTRWLADDRNEGRVVRTRLKASDRVIARVTDGIYRQPASALRELISNAWDADANNVSVLTDAPRFSRIYVRDDGVGMSYTTLARLLHSIGGSAKRTDEGQSLGVTSSGDPDLTPGGRPLIGKIGIGLFSVSQLARRFRIITKTAGSEYRLIAEVRLRTYSEDEEDSTAREADDRFISGEVSIVREAAADKASHGTDVILYDVKPRVRDLLRSADRWRALEEKARAEAEGDHDRAVHIKVDMPRYHAGWISAPARSSSEPVVLTSPAKLPWSADDAPSVRMGLLMDAVEREFSRTERPDLASTLDTYLEMLWVLGLSCPVQYVDRHPFDLTPDYKLRLYWIPSDPGSQAIEIPFDGSDTVRTALQRRAPGHPVLQEGLDAPAGAFNVRIDGVDLKRPIRFNFRATDKRSLDQSMLFVGRYEPDLKQIDERVRGGDLALEGYLFWNGRIIPKENNGVLVRIRGASGATFDPTFFKYQVSEQTRLRQITSELFILAGLDAALNIDRESFNFSHPHLLLVGSWTHRAIRLLTNKHKEVSARLRTERKGEDAAALNDSITQYSLRVWTRERGESESVPDVQVASSPAEAENARVEGAIAVPAYSVRALQQAPGVHLREREVKIQALARVLAAYRVLEDRTYSEQTQLIDAIASIFLGTVEQ